VIDGECAGGVALHCRRGVVEVRLRRLSWREERVAIANWLRAHGPWWVAAVLVRSTHLIPEVLTLGVVGITGMAGTNYRLSGLFRSE
jgi:hypothetical protein